MSKLCLCSKSKKEPHLPCPYKCKGDSDYCGIHQSGRCSRPIFVEKKYTENTFVNITKTCKKPSNIHQDTMDTVVFQTTLTPIRSTVEEWSS